MPKLPEHLQYKSSTPVLYDKLLNYMIPYSMFRDTPFRGSSRAQETSFHFLCKGKHSLQSKSYFTVVGFKLKNYSGACSWSLLMSRAACKCTMKMEYRYFSCWDQINVSWIHINFFKSLDFCIKLVNCSLKTQNNLLMNLKSLLHNLTSDRLRKTQKQQSSF